MRRGPRLLGTPLVLWDVRDVEAHVRVLLDARLDEWGARLDADKYADVLSYLLGTCWELSGLDQQGRPRRGHRVRVALDYDDFRDQEAEDKGWYANEDQAIAVGEAISTPGAIVEISEEPPPGAYDPEVGISFSTYSRRILSLRVVDWYRKTFGDARYGARDRQEISIDSFAVDDEGGSFLEGLMPAVDAVDNDDHMTQMALGW